MLIADSQVHLWAPNTPERPWPVKTPPHIPHKGMASFSEEDLLREMDAAGVSRTVIVPPSWEGERNDVALAAAQQHPQRFAVMGRLDSDRPEQLALLANWRRQQGMLGIRLTFTRGGNPKNEMLWQKAEEAGVPIMLAIATNQLHLVGETAARHPQLKLIIDHLGIPSGAIDDAAYAHFDALLALAKRPNIAVKASSQPKFTSDSYPYRWLHPYLRRVYDAFGPRRMFWGSDFTSLSCSYRQVITMFTQEIPWLSAEDLEWIMGRGLCEWIGWKVP